MKQLLQKHGLWLLRKTLNYNNFYNLVHCAANLIYNMTWTWAASQIFHIFVYCILYTITVQRPFFLCAETATRIYNTHIQPIRFILSICLRSFCFDDIFDLLIPINVRSSDTCMQNDMVVSFEYMIKIWRPKLNQLTCGIVWCAYSYWSLKCFNVFSFASFLGNTHLHMYTNVVKRVLLFVVVASFNEIMLKAVNAFLLSLFFLLRYICIRWYSYCA